MKNLANCKPSEFFAQTVKIKKSVQEWIDATDIINILKEQPVLEDIPENGTDAEKKEVFQRNIEKIKKFNLEKFSRLFDIACEKNAEKTLELLALCCFVEPKYVDDNPISYYLESFTELINDDAVISFFTSLAQLAQKNTSAQ
jgi:hypothetical protein